MKVFLDTNILVYRYDRDEPHKRALAARALAERHDFALSTQVLVELFNALTRRLARPLDPAEGQRVIESLDSIPVVGNDRELVLRAIVSSRRFQLSIWDAMIVEAAVEAGCGELWTEDLATGATIRGVRVVNPLLRAGVDPRAE